MANTDFKVNIQFRQLGLNKIDGEISKLLVEIPHLKKVIDSLGKNNPLAKSFEGSYKTLENNIRQVKKLKDLINTRFNEKSGNGTFITNTALGLNETASDKEFLIALSKQFNDIATEVLTTKSKMKAFEQATLSSFNALKESSNLYLESLKKLKIEASTLKALKEKTANIIKSSSTNKADLSAIRNQNNELKKRVTLLSEIAVKEKAINNSTLPKAILGTQIRKLQSIKNDLNSIDVPLTKIEQKFKILIPNSLITKTEKARLKLNEYIKALRLLGFNGNKLKQLRTEFDKLSKQALVSGNTSQMDKLLTSIKEREKVIKNISKLEEKINSTLASEKEKEIAIKTVKKAKIAVSNLNSSEKDIATKYYSAVTAVENLNRELKNKAIIENESAKLLRKYEQELSSLQRLVKIKSLWASPASKREAQEAIRDIQVMIQKVKEYRQISLSAKGQNVIATPKGFAEYEHNLNILKSKLSEVTTKAREAKASISNMGLVQVAKRTAAYASAYAGFYQVIGAFQQGVKYVVEFDRNLHVMSAVFEISVTKARQLQRGLVDLGKAYGGDIANINEAALALGRAGLAADDVVKATEIVIKMAKLTGDTIGVSSNALITYKQDFEDAAHPISTLGDQLAYVANQSRLSTQDIGTFSNYALASAKAAGITVEAINSMAISLSNAGVNASTIGTEIRRFSFLLRDNSSAVQKFFTSIGTSQQTLAARLRYSTESSNRAMLELIQNTAKLSDAAFAKSLQGMDIRAAEILTLLRNNYDTFAQHFKHLLEGVNGELDKSNFVASSYASTWERVKNSIGDTFRILTVSGFKSLNSDLNDFNDVLINIDNHAGKFIKNIITYGKKALYILSSIFALKAGVSVWAAISSKVKNLIGYLKTIPSLLGSTTGILSRVLGIIKTIVTTIAVFLADNPLVLVIGAIAGVTYLAYKNLTKIDDKVKSISQTQIQINNQLRLASNIRQQQVEKAKIEAEMSKAVEAGDKKRVKILADKIAKIDVIITKLSTEKNIADKILQKTQQHNKLLEAQAKIYSLNSEKKTLSGINTKEAKERITQIDEELQKLQKETKLYLQVENRNKVLESINTLKTSINTLKTNLKNIENNNNIPTKQKEVLEKSILHIIDLQNNKIKKQTQLLRTTNTETKKQLKGTKKGYFTIDSKDIQNYNQLNKQLNALYNTGANIATSKKAFKTSINDAIHNYAKSVKSVFENDFKDFTQNTSLFKDLPVDIKTLFSTIRAESTNLKNPKTLAEYNANLIQLKIRLRDLATTDPKALNILQTIVDKAQNGASKLQQLQTIYKQIDSIGKIDKTKLSFTPFHETTSGKTAYQTLIAKYNTLKEKEKQLVNIQNNKITHLDKIKIIEQQIADNETKQINMSNRYVELTAKRKKIIEELNRLDGTGTITQKKEKEKELSNIDKEIKATEKSIFNIEKDRLSLGNSLVSQKIKEAEAIRKVNAETIAMQTKLKAKGTANPFLTKIEELKKELNYNPATDKQGEKGNAYFNNLAAYVAIKKRDLQNKKYDPNNYGAVQSGQGIAYYADQYNKAPENAQAEQENKLQVIQDQQTMLQEQFQAGYISMSEMQMEYQALEIQREQAHADAMVEINRKRFNATIGIYGAGANTLANTIDNLHKAGLIKSKGALRAMKAMQIVAATASTYTAVTMALASPPGPPWSYLTAAMALAKGLANVAMIKAQKYHTGGYVSATNGGAMGGLRDDEIPAILKRNEYVLTHNDVKAIKSNKAPELQTQEPQKHETVIINSVDPSLIEDWATSRQGREVIRNIVNA